MKNGIYYTMTSEMPLSFLEIREKGISPALGLSRLLGLSRGEELTGQVVSVQEDNRAFILFRGIPVTALIPEGIGPGMTIKVRVLSLEPQLVMQLLSKVQSQGDGFNSFLRSLLPSHQPWDQWTDAIIRSLFENEGLLKTVIPGSDRIERLTHSLMPMVVDEDKGFPTAKAIRDLILDSGLNYEAKLRRFVIKGPSEMTNRQVNTSTLPLARRATGSESLGLGQKVEGLTRLPRVAKHYGQGNTPSCQVERGGQGPSRQDGGENWKFLYDELIFKDTKGKLMVLLKELDPFLRKGNYQRATTLELVSNLKTGLQNIELLQTSNYLASEENRVLIFLLPVSYGDERAQIEVRLRKERKGNKDGEEKEIIKLAFLLRLQSLGGIRVDAYLKQKQSSLGCKIEVEREELVPVIRTLLPKLDERLKLLGFIVEELTCLYDNASPSQWKENRWLAFFSEGGMINVLV